MNFTVFVYGNTFVFYRVSYKAYENIERKIVSENSRFTENVTQSETYLGQVCTIETFSKNFIDKKKKKHLCHRYAENLKGIKNYSVYEFRVGH